ncbi:MAG: tetratricopeptide repeat protein [Candidatus Omnitrophota bacterium]|nr:MAG: tetratricopeptide repeat protein [Candidatus Omnitrophota bacterium]
MKLKEWNQALAYLNEVPGIDPRTKFARKASLYRGVVYKLKGDYEEARRIFNEIKDELGGELGAFSYYEEGATLYRMGKFDEAAKVFEEAFQKDPTLQVNQISQFRAGYIKMYDLRRVEKFEEIPPIEIREIPEVVPPKVEEEEIVEAVKEIVRIAPETDLAAQMARIYMLRGFELARQGHQLLKRQDVRRGRERFRLAREQFDLAIDLDPKSGLSRSGRAISLYFLKDFDEALQEAKRAKEISPDDAEVLANLGYIYAQRAMIDRAIEEYRDAVKLAPDSYVFNYNLGTLYAMKENYSKATVHLAKAKQINPTLPEIYNNLGCVYWEDKKYNRAKQEFEKGLSMEKSYLESHYNLGVVLYNLEQYEKAKKEFDWVKKVRPAYRKTKWYLDHIKKKLSD